MEKPPAGDANDQRHKTSNEIEIYIIVVIEKLTLEAEDVGMLA